MKRNFMKTISGIVLAFLVISTIAVGSVVAQFLERSDRGGGRLEGTWDVQVTVRDCQTGAAIRTYPELQTFMFGGTMLASTSGIPPSRVTPGQGVWSHHYFFNNYSNNYSFKFKDFNFDANGNFTGWVIIKHEVNLNQSANGFESTGTAEVYAPNGSLLFTGCAAETATRFE